jgi:MFS family permease
MIRLVLAAKSLRAFGDGFVAVLLPAYLLALGHGQLEVGVLSTATLLGSTLATLAVGRWGNRFQIRALLIGAALLMGATGVGFASLTSLWPLLVVSFVGTINPSSGDVSVFQPLEHTLLAGFTDSDTRTTVFARYSFCGSLFGAMGALSAAVPELLVGQGMALVDGLRVMFVVYGAIGAVVWLIYLRLPRVPTAEQKPAAPLGPSRSVVWKLAALFSLNSFATSLVVGSLLALWLFERFGMSLTAAGAFFFWAGLATATSQLLAPRVAKRIGLVNTMVFTHIPAQLCLIAAAFAPSLAAALTLLIVRSALSQMDVPARAAYVMSVVTPEERPAAASFTAVPRSLASAISPSLGGAMFAAGMMAAPLVSCGLLNIAYDVALWIAFRRVEGKN